MKIRFGVFSLALFVLAGCATTEYNPATEKTEVSFYSTEKEIRLGKSLAQRIEREFGVNPDELLQERARRVGEKIGRVADRQDLSYYFYVLAKQEDDKPNALALPGGYVYLTESLLELAGTDDELAGVIGHEVGHIVSRHSIKRLQAAFGYNLVRIFIPPEEGREVEHQKADAAIMLLFLAYSREDELLADREGVRYARLAGYNPAAMLIFLEKLKTLKQKEPIRGHGGPSTHPYLSERLHALREELNLAADFTDYLNRPTH